MMNEKDVKILQFIKTNVLIDNIFNNIISINRNDIIESIKMIPENDKNKEEYKMFLFFLDFYDRIVHKNYEI